MQQLLTKAISCFPFLSLLRPAYAHMQMSVACQVLASWPDLANKAVPCREEAIINQKQHFCHPKSESAPWYHCVSMVCVGFSQWAFASNFKLKFIANSWQRP